MGGQNITGTTDDTVYVPHITLSGASGVPGLIRMQNSSGVYVGDVPSNNFSSHGFTDSGSPRVINRNGDESIALCMDFPYDVALDYKNNGGVDEILRIGVTTSGGTSGLTSSFGTGVPVGVIINSNDSKISSGVTQSVIIGGIGITGTTDNMVYIPDLYIDNCPAYASDGDAGSSGGLTTGMVWQTTAGHSLGVAGILMIKQ